MLRSVASCAFVLVLLMSVDGCGESPREGRLPQDRRESEYEFQRELLADGVVTASELEQAVLANMACLDRKGIRHSKPIYDESNAPPVWNYDVGPVPTEQIGPDGSPTEQTSAMRNSSRMLTLPGCSRNSRARQRCRKENVKLRCTQAAGIEADDYDALQRLIMNGTGEEIEIIVGCLSGN